MWQFCGRPHMTREQLFRQVTLRVCGTLSLSTALEQVFELLSPLLPLDELRVNILDREMHAVKTVAVADAKGARTMLHAPLVMPIPPRVEKDLSGNALADVRTVGRVEDDRATASIRSEFFPHVPESSMLLMRLLLGGERQGLLLLRAEGENRYTEDHKELMAGLNEPFAIAINNALTHHAVEQLRKTLAEENRYLAGELRGGSTEIVGASFGLAPIMELVHNVAPTESPVLLLGETGVGKELIADAIHNASGRSEGPFIKLNCGAIPRELVDSELFGHEKGAFTGAIAEKKGRFERARGGTLFLDEMGELPAEAQVRLLRVLQSKQFERVGGTRTISADVRIIAATHRDLPRLLAEGSFREDLWYRINVFPIVIPPLRQRSADIPALVHYFVQKKAAEMGVYPPPPLAEGAMDRLRSYTWPGNVRELENAVERALISGRDRPLRFDHIGMSAPDDAGPETASSPPETLDDAIARHIKRALAFADGRVGGPDGAAYILGVNPSTLRNRMKKLGIAYGRKS